jgi:hypothetical protein
MSKYWDPKPKKPYLLQEEWALSIGNSHLPGTMCAKEKSGSPWEQAAVPQEALSFVKK